MKQNKQMEQKVPLYRKAQRQSTWLYGKGPFKLRFPEIQNSLINRHFIFRLIDLLGRGKKYERQYPPSIEQIKQFIPTKLNPQFQINKNKINFTWIGHSTSVLSFGQQANFIIDPIFSERASIVSWTGPKRYINAVCKIKQLPNIDAVFVSHDHTDHLDYSSLVELQNLYKPKFFAGLGARDVIPKQAQLKQMDWTQQQQFMVKGKKFKVTFVPACHWGRRFLFDQNYRLWGGFVIQSEKGKKIFYPGDTGYCEVFKQIGQIHGPIDLAILPIGSYLPRQGLKAQHIGPQQAVMIHKQIKSKKSIGVHWGTFQSPYQHFLSCKKDLQLMKQKYGLKNDQFITINHGQNIEIDY